MTQYEIHPRGPNGLYSVKACLSGVIKTRIAEQPFHTPGV